MTRKTKYYPTDPRDLPGDNFAFVKKALSQPVLAAAPAPKSQPDALAEMLRLSTEQAQHLEGCDRLNFWRNGSLHVQVNHGGRGIKLACPQAVISDSDLTMFFLSWGWQQVSLGKLYFKPTASSLVRL